MDKKKILGILAMVLGFLSTIGVSVCSLTPAKPYCELAAPLLVLGSENLKKAAEGAGGGAEPSCEDGKTKVGEVGVCVCEAGQWLTHPDKAAPCK